MMDRKAGDADGVDITCHLVADGMSGMCDDEQMVRQNMLFVG